MKEMRFRTGSLCIIPWSRYRRKMDEGRLITTWIRIWWWGAGSMMALSTTQGISGRVLEDTWVLSFVVTTLHPRSSMEHDYPYRTKQDLSVKIAEISYSQIKTTTLCVRWHHHVFYCLPNAVIPVQHEMLLSHHGISHVWHVSFTCQIIKSESISWRACMTTSWCGLC